MPYKLQGNSVVRSDTGQVVKTHPSRAKALRHLRALKANVEEDSPAVLGSLLEGFEEVRHPRDFRGRFKAGDHVTLQHGMFGQVAAEVTKVTASRVHVTSSDPRVSDTSMTHNQAAVKLERKPSMADRRREQARIETQRRRSVDPNAPATEVYKPPTEAAIRQLARDGVYFGATDLGREGRAARERGANSRTTEHADTRDKLTNLPVGQRYGLHGPQGQVGHVQRTAAGWEVVGPSKPATVHKTPSAAAGAAMRIQRTAASSREQASVMMRNYRARGEVERMNARQSQMAAAERLRAEMDRHGGFKIGDVVTHETGSRGAGGHGPVTFTKQPGMSTVVGLQRNGNLRLKHPATGTTHDVHHSHAQKVSPLHPDYRGKVAQDAYAAQRAEVERQKAARARKLNESGPDVLGALLSERQSA